MFQRMMTFMQIFPMSFFDKREFDELMVSIISLTRCSPVRSSFDNWGDRLIFSANLSVITARWYPTKMD